MKFLKTKTTLAVQDENLFTAFGTRLTTYNSFILSSSAAQWQTLEGYYGSNPDLIGCLNAAWNNAWNGQFNVVTIDTATYTVSAENDNTAYLSINPTLGGDVVFDLPSASETGTGAVFEFLTVGNFEGETHDGMFVLLANGSDTIKWPGGSTTSGNLSSQQSFSKARLVSNGVDGWAVTDAYGMWGSATYGEDLIWVFTSAYRFDGNVPGGTEDNYVTLDAYGNIKDSGISAIGGSGDHHALTNLDYEGDHPIDVLALYEGNPAGIVAYPSVGSAYGILESSRVLSGFEMTNNLESETLTIAAGVVLLRADTSLTSNPEVFAVPEKVFTYAEISNKRRWIVVTDVTGDKVVTTSSNPGTYDSRGREQLVLGAMCSFVDPDNAELTRVYYISFEGMHQDIAAKRFCAPYRSESVKLYERPEFNLITYRGYSVSLEEIGITSGDWLLENTSVQSSLTWLVALTDEGGSVDAFTASNALDPTRYNNNVAGTLVAATNGWFVCHYLFLIRHVSTEGDLIAQYGTSEYSTIEEALAEKLVDFADVTSPEGLAVYVGKVVTRAPYIVGEATIIEGAIVAIQPANKSPQLFDVGSRPITVVPPTDGPGAYYEVLGINRTYVFLGSGQYSYTVVLPEVSSIPMGGWVEILYKYSSMEVDDLIITPFMGDLIDWIGGNSRTSLTTTTLNSKLRFISNGVTGWQASDGNGTWVDSASTSVTFEETGGTSGGTPTTSIKTADYPVVVGDANNTVFVMNSSLPETFTLEAAPATDRYLAFVNKGSGTCTVDGNGKNISGETTIPLGQYESITIIYDGATWLVL